MKLQILFALVFIPAREAFISSSNGVPRYERSGAINWDESGNSLDENFVHWVNDNKIPSAWEKEVTEAEVTIDAFWLVGIDQKVIAAGKAMTEEDMKAADHIALGYTLKVGGDQKKDKTSITWTALIQAGAAVAADGGVGKWYHTNFGAEAVAKLGASLALKNGFSAELVGAFTTAIQIQSGAFETVGIKGEGFAGAKAAVAFTLDVSKAEFSAGGELFVGVRASAKVNARWFSLKATAEFGAGATCRAEMKDGELAVEFAAAAGPGAGLGFSINFAQIGKDAINHASFIGGCIAMLPKPPNPCSTFIALANFRRFR